jgi:hypothetical protein
MKGRPLRAGRADAAGPDAEIVLAAHRRDSAHRVKQMKSRKKRRSRGLRKQRTSRMSITH